jgi:hypothetical protein
LCQDRGVVTDTNPTRRQEALVLAEELLSDIELSRISRPDVPRKASRLARLLDDQDAIAWLRYDVGGYSASVDPETESCQARDSFGTW